MKAKELPSAASIEEMPEIDFKKVRVIRRGPPYNHRVTLAALRDAYGITQGVLARRAKISQSEISRAELRSDCLVSTLSRYASALGGEVEIVVRIDGRAYPIALRP